MPPPPGSRRSEEQGSLWIGISCSSPPFIAHLNQGSKRTLITLQMRTRIRFGLGLSVFAVSVRSKRDDG